MFNILFQLQDLFDLIQYKFECSSQIKNLIDIFKTVGNMYLNLTGWLKRDYIENANKPDKLKWLIL